MIKKTPQEAFYIAPPRRPAVVCVLCKDGKTRLIKTEWFSWLNMRHQPMLSFSLLKKSDLVLREDDTLLLAFPSPEEAQLYKEGFILSGDEQDPNIPETRIFEVTKTRVPSGTTLVLRCTLANAYNYLFGKTRIYNCNLEEATEY